MSIRPLASVTISIKDHLDPSSLGTGFGQTLSQQNSLSVQRQVDAPWREYVWLLDVAMVGLDSEVPYVTLAEDSWQVA